MLDRDPHDTRAGDLRRVRVLLTVLDGEAVYRDPKLAWK